MLHERACKKTTNTSTDSLELLPSAALLEDMYLDLYCQINEDDWLNGFVSLRRISLKRTSLIEGELKVTSKECEVSLQRETGKSGWKE